MHLSLHFGRKKKKRETRKIHTLVKEYNVLKKKRLISNILHCLVCPADQLADQMSNKKVFILHCGVMKWLTFRAAADHPTSCCEDIAKFSWVGCNGVDILRYDIRKCYLSLCSSYILYMVFHTY